MIVKWLRRFLLLLLFVAVGWFATRTLWDPGTINFKYDWGFSIFNWQHTTKGVWWVWDGSGLGGAVLINTAWVVLGIMSAVGQALHIAVDLFLKGWLAGVVALSGLGMVWLLRRRQVIWPIAILAGLLYALSPVLYIRFIVGFTLYQLAFALTPWWLGLWWSLGETKRPRRTAAAAAVLYALASAQQQFLILLFILMIVDWLVADPTAQVRRRKLYGMAWAIGLVIAVHLPWLFMAFRGGVGVVGQINSSGSSLSFISTLPHSLLRTLLGVDHHITYPIFDQLLLRRTFILGGFSLLFFAFLASLSRRREVRVMLVVLGLVWPLALGPQIPTADLFIWLYTHLPLTNFFREVYHWSVLISLTTIVAAAFGWQYLWERMGRWRWVGILLWLLPLGLLRPFVEGHFNNYLVPHQVASEYQQLTAPAYKDGRTFFMPPLGFDKLKADQTPGAMNTDVLAVSTGRSQLPAASSTLDLGGAGLDARNAFLASWYQLPGAPVDTSGYLRAFGVSEVVDRPQLQSEFMYLFQVPKGLSRIQQLWMREDYDNLAAAQPIESVARNAVYTQYRVNSVAPLISLAKTPVTGAFDWQQLNGPADAVFYLEDLTATQKAAVAALPTVTSKDDWLASFWQTDNVLGRLQFTVAAEPELGWARKPTVWWRAANLATARESYLYTTTSVSAKGTLPNLVSGNKYRVLLKSWSGTGTLTVSLGDWHVTQAEPSSQDWQWRDLGDVVVAAANPTIAVQAEGEAGLAQLLVVPEESYQAQLKAWEARANEPYKAPRGEVTFTQDNPTHFTVAVTTDRQSWILVRQTYDPGWRLILDGTSYSPVLADGYAMAFEVPGGDWHGQLTFIYEPIYRGLEVVSLALLGGVILYAWGPRRRTTKKS